MTTADHDQRHMARALELAERGAFTTTPNPRVGCVIAKGAEMLGEGWHEKAGMPHAEVNALAAAANAGKATQGGIAYVTLEPCNHHGRTPPCVDALIAAGISRVVIAIADPHAEAGGGMQRLRSAGIEVECGLMEAEAQELNRGFISRVTRGRPWLRLKTAASLDGKTALENGISQWITGREARRDGHAFRARACAILTGIGTVKDDDPRLNVREVETPRQPLRVVVDSRFEIPLSAKILEGGNVLIAIAHKDPAKAAALRSMGADTVFFPNPHGKVDLLALMHELGRRDINELHVEAGTRLNGSLLNEGLVDELLVYLAPMLIGDAAHGMFHLPALSELGAARRLTIFQQGMIGADLRIRARAVTDIGGDSGSGTGQ
jgi:diaminohydroxyphosphoribosylaminopyrimidine deaminase/5-amino-6-(5-phosphoribosylamino)uracil reductase